MYALLAIAFTACQDDTPEEYPLPDGQGALLIELNGSSPVNGIALYLFGNDGTTDLYKAYGDSQELASEYIPVNAGNYTLLLVAGADSTALPQETTAPDLAEWLKENGGAYPNLLTASTPTEVKAGEVNLLFLELTDGTSGIHLSTVRLALTVPGLDLPAYATRANGSDSKPLRCVAEVYQAGTSNRVHRRVQDCALQSDGTFLAELSLMPGDYDLRLWADWDGGYYNADDLGKVLVLTDSYVANGETDKKDAYYGTASIYVETQNIARLSK